MRPHALVIAALALPAAARPWQQPALKRPKASPEARPGGIAALEPLLPPLTQGAVAAAIVGSFGLASVRLAQRERDWIRLAAAQLPRLGQRALKGYPSSDPWISTTSLIILVAPVVAKVILSLALGWLAVTLSHALVPGTTSAISDALAAARRPTPPAGRRDGPSDAGRLASVLDAVDAARPRLIALALALLCIGCAGSLVLSAFRPIALLVEAVKRADVLGVAAAEGTKTAIDASELLELAGSKWTSLPRPSRARALCDGGVLLGAGAWLASSPPSLRLAAATRAAAAAALDFVRHRLLLAITNAVLACRAAAAAAVAAVASACSLDSLAALPSTLAAAAASFAAGARVAFIAIVATIPATVAAVAAGVASAWTAAVPALSAPLDAVAAAASSAYAAAASACAAIGAGSACDAVAAAASACTAAVASACTALVEAVGAAMRAVLHLIAAAACKVRAAASSLSGDAAVVLGKGPKADKRAKADEGAKGWRRMGLGGASEKPLDLAQTVTQQWVRDLAAAPAELARRVSPLISRYLGAVVDALLRLWRLALRYLTIASSAIVDGGAAAANAAGGAALAAHAAMVRALEVAISALGIAISASSSAAEAVAARCAEVWAKCVPGLTRVGDMIAAGYAPLASAALALWRALLEAARRALAAVHEALAFIGDWLRFAIIVVVNRTVYFLANSLEVMVWWAEGGWTPPWSRNREQPAAKVK